MKKIVLLDYEIHNDMLAIIPAYNPDYDTIVIEHHQQLYVKKTPLQLIEAACLKRRCDLRRQTNGCHPQNGSNHNVPIPINPLEQIYAFPIHSATEHEYTWIFYHHVKSIQPYKKRLYESTITFMNGINLPLVVSHAALKQQMKRTLYCVICFSNRSTNDDEIF
ncbi:competence protein [bacterium LRH843]|nr:competence protein [bacterium LRH843]